MAKVQITFYSTYGHVYKLAEAVAEGARGIAGGPGGERQPTATELAIARARGRHVATIATKLAAK